MKIGPGQARIRDLAVAGATLVVSVTVLALWGSALAGLVWRLFRIACCR